MSQERYDELMAAGAPKLPEGYSYNIRWSTIDTGRMIVEVYRNSGYGSSILSSAAGAWYSTNDDRLKKRLVRACKRSHRRAQLEMNTVNSRWIGRHP